MYNKKISSLDLWINILFSRYLCQTLCMIQV